MSENESDPQKPMIPPGVDPDDVQIHMLTPGDYLGLVVAYPDGRLAISTDPMVSPEFFSAILLNVVVHISRDTGTDIGTILKEATGLLLSEDPPPGHPDGECTCGD